MLQLKKCFKLILICYLVFLQVSLIFAEIRLTGGNPTNISAVPYLVKLLDNGKFICSGTLVSPRHVVTAKNCVRGRPERRLSISAGATMLTDAGVKSSVCKIILPEAFNINTAIKDVAVLKLYTAVEGPDIRPTDLCKKNWQPGARVQVSGWGLKKSNYSYLSDQLRTANVKVIRKSRCAKLYRGKKHLNKLMFCASISGRRDSCFGGSGGPAFINDQFCGVESWGVGCSHKAYPGVYTSVLAVRKFIKQAMQT